MIKTAVVLAGSRGIGLGCASALKASNHRVVLFSRAANHLEAAREQLGGDVDTICGDLFDVEDLNGVFEHVRRAYGGCDVLVANTPGPPEGDVLSLTDEDWRLGMEQYALPVFRAIRAVVPSMRARRFGRVIVIASLSVKQPLSGLDLSNFIRPGLAGVLRCLARSVASDGVTVHTICPGAILTDRSEKRIRARADREGRTYEESLQLSEKGIPVGYLGTPDDVGALVGFLASDAARFLTGNVIQVDGGQSVGIF